MSILLIHGPRLIIKGVRSSEGAMTPKELKQFKEAAEKLRRELDTPEKRKAFLVKIGYLNPDGQVAESYR
jgi:hypothetical protein